MVWTWPGNACEKQIGTFSVNLQKMNDIIDCMLHNYIT